MFSMRTSNTTRMAIAPLRTALLAAALGVGLTAAVLLGGCDLPSDWTRPVEPRMIGGSNIFAIDEGTRVQLGRQGTMLSFKDVAADSRCPTDVECVWAGEADAEFRLRDGDLDTTFTLTIPGLVETPYESNVEIPIQDFRFRLLELKPYPTSEDTSQKRSPYRALIAVEMG